MCLIRRWQRRAEAAMRPYSRIVCLFAQNRWRYTDGYIPFHIYVDGWINRNGPNLSDSCQIRQIGSISIYPPIYIDMDPICLIRVKGNIVRQQR